MDNKTVFSVLKRCAIFFVMIGLFFAPQLSYSGHAIEKSKPTDAEWLVDSGENHIWYRITEDILTVGGVGEMPDLGSGEVSPWYDSRSSIRQVVVEEGITRIGNNSFRGEEADKYTSIIEDALLPKTLTSIGNDAFRYNGSLIVVAIKNPTPPSIGEGIFWDTSEGIAFVVPASAHETYLNSDWKVNEEANTGYLFDFNTFSAYFAYIAESDGGTVSSTLDYIAAEFYTPQTVDLTVTPDEGYFLKSLTVTAEDGSNIPVEDGSFVMPEKSVTITAVFGSTEGPEIPDCPDTGVVH